MRSSSPDLEWINSGVCYGHLRLQVSAAGLQGGSPDRWSLLVTTVARMMAQVVPLLLADRREPACRHGTFYKSRFEPKG